MPEIIEHNIAGEGPSLTEREIFYTICIQYLIYISSTLYITCRISYEKTDWKVSVAFVNNSIETDTKANFSTSFE